ncbi:LemA family protein [Membranihabitans maritimus]|uniref:LemA family protein n=1 Tax=Membranihabitans maritimus TaxID=2904244 RepID=UPI001F444315|nr:LemA family protein [Membranihabitans maritimus]
MTYFIIALIISIVLIFWGINIYNRLIKNRNMMEEGLSGIDVQLKKRHDLIPGLLNTVKAYAQHEKETLTEVIEARNKAIVNTNEHPEDIESTAVVQNQLSAALGKLFALAENYPELKADSNFKQFQTELSDIEADIEKARRYYNATVRDYNITVESFPSNMVASMGQFKRGQFFELENPADRSLPEVKF